MATKSKTVPSSKKSGKVITKKVDRSEEEQLLDNELKELRGELAALTAPAQDEPEEKPAVSPGSKNKAEKPAPKEGEVVTKTPKGTIDLDKPKTKGKTEVIKEDADLVTAKQLASDCGVEAKILRRTLRRLQAEGKIETRDGRWEWPAGSPDIKTILKAFKKA